MSVADVGEFVVGQFALAAFIVSEKRAGQTDTLDDVVFEGEALEIAFGLRKYKVSI